MASETHFCIISHPSARLGWFKMASETYVWCYFTYFLLFPLAWDGFGNAFFTGFHTLPRIGLYSAIASGMHFLRYFTCFRSFGLVWDNFINNSEAIRIHPLVLIGWMWLRERSFHVLHNFHSHILLVSLVGWRWLRQHTFYSISILPPIWVCSRWLWKHIFDAASATSGHFDWLRPS